MWPLVTAYFYQLCKKSETIILFCGQPPPVDLNLIRKIRQTDGHVQKVHHDHPGNLRTKIICNSEIKKLTILSFVQYFYIPIFPCFIICQASYLLPLSVVVAH